jgi:hypothetical protein
VVPRPHGLGALGSLAGAPPMACVGNRGRGDRGHHLAVGKHQDRPPPLGLVPRQHRIERRRGGARGRGRPRRAAAGAAGHPGARGGEHPEQPLPAGSQAAVGHDQARPARDPGQGAFGHRAQDVHPALHDAVQQHRVRASASSGVLRRVSVRGQPHHADGRPASGLGLAHELDGRGARHPRDDLRRGSGPHGRDHSHRGLPGGERRPAGPFVGAVPLRSSRSWCRSKP